MFKFFRIEKVQSVPDLREILKREDVGPIIRRFFINTLFDSTFVLLGIVVGAAFAVDARLNVVLVTMVTSSLALGVSTGISVYEADSLERERKIAELEKALFRDLSNTKIEKTARSITILTAIINFLTPFVSCAVMILPFIFAIWNNLEINVASWFSVTLALGILFSAGVYLGKLGKTNPWTKGLRMAGFGFIAFIIGFLLNTLV
jgi:predicted membrane protein (TIGR00267 family)